jgi:hypothetical protein
MEWCFHQSACAAQTEANVGATANGADSVNGRGVRPTGMPKGACPWYVIDHIDPPEWGGADAPFNMQRQTIAEGKAKDRTERNCRIR